MIGAIKTALSGLLAQGQRAAAASSNIANAYSSGSLEDENNAPYAAVDTQLTSQKDGGVNAQTFTRDPSFVTSYAPNSPFANAEGYIGAPNVSLEEEIVTLKQAELAYKANLKTIKIASEMQEELLNSFDEKI